MSLSIKINKNKKKWDNFITSSPQGNVFSTTPFLEALDVDKDLLFVKKDRRLQIGALVLKRNRKPLPAPHPFTLYQGIYFNKLSRKMTHHRRLKWALKMTDFLLNKMEKRYRFISLCLHYTAEDLRSFQWFHYHQPKKGQFKINLRYTGLIDLKKHPNFKSYLGKIRKVRRYEYHQAKKNGLKTELSQEVDILDHLHGLTFKRQGVKRRKIDVQTLRNITNAALSYNFGELLLCRNAKGKAISATLFLFDKKCAYYLISANHPCYRHTGSGTFLILENIRRCFKRKIAKVDLCGINSPNRGDFKTSFNASPVPYFVVTWEQP